MILVTGAAGKTGRAVLKALLRRKAAVRVFVRGRDQAADLLAAGAAEALIGDFASGDALRSAVNGISSLCHICPNMYPAETGVGQSMIRFAAEAGVKHFVYHSVLHPQTEKMPHHWNKLRVEEMLFEASLDFTILQPAPYMQNILASRELILNKGVYRAPYPATTALSLIDLDDLGEAAATVLTEEGHKNTTYELCGTAAMSQIEIVSALAEIKGAAVVYEEISIDDWCMEAAALGLGEYARSTLIEMFRYYAAYGLKGSTNQLRWLLRREPSGFHTFARREIF